MANYKRINKPTARRMFNMGYSIFLTPCKTGLMSKFIQPVAISLATCEHTGNKFDRTVNNFEYYNCNAELGYYAHYYVSEEDLDKYYTYQKEDVPC